MDRLVASPAIPSMHRSVRRMDPFAGPVLGRALFLLRPPYERPCYVTSWSSLSTAATGSGTIAGVRLDRGELEGLDLDGAVRTLRSHFPAVPVVLMLHVLADEGLLVTTLASRMHVRAVLLEGHPIVGPLRHLLTQTAGIEDEVVEWLSLAGLRLSPLVMSLIHQIFALAPYFHDLSDLLAATGTPATSARFRMHKRRLPPPSRWFQAARALHVALRIQAESSTCLAQLARAWGYADHSALSQLVQRSFGLRPGAIRGTLGWEWLLERWIRQEHARHYFISLRMGPSGHATPALTPNIPPLRQRGLTLPPALLPARSRG